MAVRRPRARSSRTRILADTLEAFARQGRTPDHVRDALLDGFGVHQGGLLTADDLLAYRPEVRPPHAIDLGPFRAFTSPLLGGHLVGVIVRALEAEPFAEHEAARVLALARASAAGHTARTARAARGSTTHISVLDEGAAAAITLTNGEGSGHLASGTGIQVNNFLGEEDLSPHGFHRHAAGTRLPTMIAPTVALFEGRPSLALGSGGFEPHPQLRGPGAVAPRLPR